MAQAMVNIRMDEALKSDFEALCNDLGLNMSTASTIFAKKMVRENRIPFEVSLDPFYGERNMRAIHESREQLLKGRVVVKSMEELEAMATDE